MFKACRLDIHQLVRQRCTIFPFISMPGSGSELASAFFTSSDDCTDKSRSGPHWKWQKYLGPLAAAMYSHRGSHCLRRHLNYIVELGCPQVENHHHSASGTSRRMVFCVYTAYRNKSQPELVSGTIRQNLDPFAEHDDVDLNDALCSAGLFSLQNKDLGHKLGLETPVSGAGQNLSVGQRQILALARAIVRRTKLVILDEGWPTS